MRKKRNISLIKITIIIQIVLILLPNAFALAGATEDEKVINIIQGKNKQYSIQKFNEETKEWECIDSAVKYYTNESEEKNIVYCISKNFIIEESIVQNNEISNELNLKETNVLENSENNNIVKHVKENILVNQIENTNGINENIIEENNIVSENTVKENNVEDQIKEEKYIIKNSATLVDERILRILENSYPKLSLEELGLEYVEDAYTATEEAIEYVLKNRKLEEFSEYYRVVTEDEESEVLEEQVVASKEKDLLKAIKKLIDIAYNGQQTENNISEVLEELDKYIVYQVKRTSNEQEFIIITNIKNDIENEKDVVENVEEPTIDETEKEEEDDETPEDKEEEEVIQPEEDVEEKLQVENEEENPDIYIKQYYNNTARADEEIVYQYEIKNTGNTTVSNFTWYCVLPSSHAKITKIITGTYNKDVNYTIYYKTNKKYEYTILKQHINSKENVGIDLINLEIEDDEIIEEIKVCFEEVDIGFCEDIKPCIYMKINEQVEDNTQIKNYAILDGYNQNYKVTCEDIAQSVIYNIEKQKKLPRTGY